LSLLRQDFLRLLYFTALSISQLILSFVQLT
jgi:hypothetical protein